MSQAIPAWGICFLASSFNAHGSPGFFKSPARVLLFSLRKAFRELFGRNVLSGKKDFPFGRIHPSPNFTGHFPAVLPKLENELFRRGKFPLFSDVRKQMELQRSSIEIALIFLKMGFYPNAPNPLKGGIMPDVHRCGIRDSVHQGKTGIDTGPGQELPPRNGKVCRGKPQRSSPLISGNDHAAEKVGISQKPSNFFHSAIPKALPYPGSADNVPVLPSRRNRLEGFFTGGAFFLQHCDGTHSCLAETEVLSHHDALKGIPFFQEIQKISRLHLGKLSREGEYLQRGHSKPIGDTLPFLRKKEIRKGTFSQNRLRIGGKGKDAPGDASRICELPGFFKETLMPQMKTVKSPNYVDHDGSSSRAMRPRGTKRGSVSSEVFRLPKTRFSERCTTREFFHERTPQDSRKRSRKGTAFPLRRRSAEAISGHVKTE
jgi:hypothetical protein